MCIFNFNVIFRVILGDFPQDLQDCKNLCTLHGTCYQNYYHTA